MCYPSKNGDKREHLTKPATQDKLLLPCAGAVSTDDAPERKMLMHAVSALKMENTCLVDALGARINEVEALRCSATSHPPCYS
jgi:hypothetical protein